MYCAELCGCIVGNGNRDILHGSRFAMFPGLFIYEPPILHQNFKRENFTNSKVALQFRKDENQEEDAIPYGYGFFHFVFATGAMYFAMLLVGWNIHHSMKK